MATPIISRITDNLIAALAAVDAGSGDYAHTLYPKEPDAVGDAVQDGTCIVDLSDWNYDENPPVGKHAIFQDFEVNVYVRGGTERNWKMLGREYACDVEKAVMLDETRGGLARWTRVDGVRPFAPGALRGVTILIRVLYWTTINRPDLP